MHFGLDIQEKGFNNFVAGLSGTGRTTAIERFLDEVAVAKRVPPDWCYVHNFDDGYCPHAIQLPAGQAREFQKELDGMLRSISQWLASWARKQQIELAHIQPGKPAQNAYIERFNRTFREDVLDAYLFADLQEVSEITQQ